VCSTSTRGENKPFAAPDLVTSTAVSADEVIEEDATAAMQESGVGTLRQFAM
jgi:hypothetical protein